MLHPATGIEMLTNGRRLADPALVSQLFEPAVDNVSWLVPLYGHASYLHDFVVQAPGAFDQTIGGLLALQEHGQPIQLRVVLIDPVLRFQKGLRGFAHRSISDWKNVFAAECEGYCAKDQCAGLFAWHERGWKRNQVLGAIVAGVQGLQGKGVAFGRRAVLCRSGEDVRHAAEALASQGVPVIYIGELAQRPEVTCASIKRRSSVTTASLRSCGTILRNGCGPRWPS